MVTVCAAPSGSDQQIHRAIAVDVAQTHSIETKGVSRDTISVPA
jgi:hypothetical protein